MPTPDLIPASTLPGPGHEDPFASALTQADADLDTIPTGDAYAGKIVPPLRAVLASLGLVRGLCWSASDALLERFGATAALTTAQQEQARATVPTWGYGPVGNGDRASAQDAASRDVWIENKTMVARAVLAERNQAADDAANGLAEKLTAASAAVVLASKQYTGPLSLRPGFTRADADACDVLEREIKRAGVVWAGEYLDAALAASVQSDHDVHVFACACLRVIQDVRAEPPIMTDRRMPSQGGVAASNEREAADALYTRIDWWLANHRPASLTTGAKVLTAATSVAFDLCGAGNLGRLSAAQFENAILNPEKAGADVARFQVRSGWLGSWIGAKASPPPGFSPIAGRTTRGLPYRFAKDGTS